MPIIKDALLKDYAYYGTGGPCTVVYRPESLAELVEHVRDAKRRNLDLMVLGAGTNSLVMDEPYAGACVVFGGLATLTRRGDVLTAGAGIDNTTLAQAALTAGLTGVGWMNRLPGQLGGTVRMNARCYGGEISQVVTAVEAVTRTGDVKIYTDTKIFRGYKNTVFMDNGDLIAAVDVTLKSGDPTQISQLMSHCESDRKGKGQFDFPSCGCVFKNDYGIGLPSGMLLEAAGAKSLRHGGAEVSPYHANFVYNKGASSRAILELTIMMRQRVYDVFGAWMEYEMELLGSPPSDLAAQIDEARPHRLNEAALAPLRARMATKPL